MHPLPSSPHDVTPDASLEALRARLAGLQPARARGVWRFGDERVDGCLPGGGVPRGVLHEVSAGGIEAESGAVAAAFLACVLSGMAPAGDVFWIAPTADLYPPGLLPYGFDPGRLVQVLTRNDSETLAVLEAVLRSGAAVAAVGEAGRLGRVAAHRLHLACLRRGSTGFVLRRWPHGRQGDGEAPIAAVTRWDIAAAPSAAAVFAEAGREPGLARWRVRLTHARGGVEGSWIMQAPGGADASHSLRVVAELAPAAAAQPVRSVR